MKISTFSIDSGHKLINMVCPVEKILKKIKINFLGIDLPIIKCMWNNFIIKNQGSLKKIKFLWLKLVKKLIESGRNFLKI